MLGRLKDQLNMTLAQGQEEAKNRRRQFQEEDQLRRNNKSSNKLSQNEEDAKNMDSVVQKLNELQNNVVAFQKLLQEKTPLSSIQDLEGFREFMENLEHRYEMTVSEVRRLSHEVNDLQTDRENLKHQFEDQIEKLNSEISNQNSLILQKKDELEKSIQRCSELEEKINSLESAQSIEQEVISSLKDDKTVETKNDVPEVSRPSTDTIGVSSALSKKKKKRNRKNQKKKSTKQNIEATTENDALSESISTPDIQKVAQSEDVDAEQDTVADSKEEERRDIANDDLIVNANAKEPMHHFSFTDLDTLLNWPKYVFHHHKIHLADTIPLVFLDLKPKEYTVDLETPKLVEELTKQLHVAESTLKENSEKFKQNSESLKSRVDNLNDYITKLQNEIDECRRNLLWAESSCETIREENQKNIKKLNDAESLKSRLLQSRTQMQTELDSYITSNSQLKDEITSLKQTVSESEAERKRLFSSAQEKQLQMKETVNKLTSLQEQNNEFDRQLKEQEEDLQNKEEELTELRKLLREQTQDSQKLRLLVEQLELERQDLKQAGENHYSNLSSDYETQIKSLESSLTNSQAECVSFQEKINELNSQIDELKLKLNEANKKYQELAISFENSNVKTQSVEPDNGLSLEALKNENQTLLKNLEDSTARYEHLQKSFKNVFNQLRKQQPSNHGRNSSVSRSSSSVEVNSKHPGSDDMLIDKEYTRNILFQFLEQRDRRPEIVNLLSILLDLSEEQKQKLLSVKY
ncbi:Golgi GRIP domain protein Grp1 [Schizosaccharomyces pombe]|uniref:GRIP and coiled-coil domain-containing protein C27D7.02c n=1 Tax=Schizosaccharomyces pombe (strain 972 / ATCC 24843) TaxID=284812 RepID=YF82_SCHPO|nr:putative GRIP domain-containing protein [Schizosaccharomyces pombe]O42657.1 RecName: Full=GRIP and coiled-coil domain-containing protein C27D7.02c [Schizosaccharomyces pombe 972h-]CAA15821.1 GRIP domain protein (predicted) [Schizosaccharomyces pombe]|eukprot:NP_594608.1 putative GRIP domain-containing protein [Schizosaccharomyces pombe]